MSDLSGTCLVVYFLWVAGGSRQEICSKTGRFNSYQNKVGNGSGVAFILASAILIYSSSLSIPIKFLPSFLQAIPVVPLPINGSRTVAPSRLTRFTRYSIRARGFTVGCLQPPISSHPILRSALLALAQ